MKIFDFLPYVQVLVRTFSKSVSTLWICKLFCWYILGFSVAPNTLLYMLHVIVTLFYTCIRLNKIYPLWGSMLLDLDIGSKWNIVKKQLYNTYMIYGISLPSLLYVSSIFPERFPFMSIIWCALVWIFFLIFIYKFACLSLQSFMLILKRLLWREYKQKLQLTQEVRLVKIGIALRAS